MASYGRGSAYDDVPEGLHVIKTQQGQDDARAEAIQTSLEQLGSVMSGLVKVDKSLEDELRQQSLLRRQEAHRFAEEATSRKLAAEELKKKGFKDDEILSYLHRREDIYSKETKKVFEGLEDQNQKLTRLVDESEELSVEQKILLRRQLKEAEKAYNFQNLQSKKVLPFLENIQKSTKETFTTVAAGGKSNRNETLGALGSALLGPFRLLADPISELITGKSISDTITDTLDKRGEKNDEDRGNNDSRLDAILDAKDQNRIDSIAVDNRLLLEEQPPADVLGERQLEFTDDEDSGLSKEQEEFFEKTQPTSAHLLTKGGVVGASAVYLGKLLGDITDTLDDVNENKDEESSLDNLLSGKGALGGKIAKMFPVLASAAGVAAVAAIPIAMIAGGLSLQKRDSEDASKYVEKEEYGRAAETAWLGDRERLTEETANVELGRATGKTALLAGGTTGVVALGAGGAAAGMSAGAAASAAGAGLLGTAGAAAGAAAAAVLPPVLIAAAVAAGVTVIAKGTQEALTLGWDTNQAKIQKELSVTLLDSDSTFIDKVKARTSSLWKEFTGTIAGGIREAGDELTAEETLQQQKQIDYLTEQAKTNDDSARLLEMITDAKFKALSKADQTILMESEGVYDDFINLQADTSKTVGEHLLTAGRTVSSFFTGAAETQEESLKGKLTALWEANQLTSMKDITREDSERLKQSDAYTGAIAGGKNAKDAMSAAFLAEKKQTAIARGDLDDDGMYIDNSLIGKAKRGLTSSAYKTKKSDEDYRQTHEYEQKKAVLMSKGLSSQDADLKVLEEQGAIYEAAMTLRLKQTEDYKAAFDKQLKEGKSIKEAEKNALNVARENKRNTMTTTDLIKDKFSVFFDLWTEVANWMSGVGTNIGDGLSKGLKKVVDFGGIIGDFAQTIWDSVKDALSEKLSSVGKGLSDAGGWFKDRASDAFNFVTRKPTDSVDDGIITKDGKVIELSPDDNVYATKNEPMVVGDRDAQRAIPPVQKEAARMTDAGIIAAIQTLTDVLKSKDMTPSIITQDNSMVNFDMYRSAYSL